MFWWESLKVLGFVDPRTLQSLMQNFYTGCSTEISLLDAKILHRLLNRNITSISAFSHSSLFLGHRVAKGSVLIITRSWWRRLNWMIKFTGRPKLTDTIAAVVRADDLILDLIDKNRAVRETCQSLKSHQFL